MIYVLSNWQSITNPFTTSLDTYFEFRLTRWNHNLQNQKLRHNLCVYCMFFNRYGADFVKMMRLDRREGLCYQLQRLIQWSRSSAHPHGGFGSFAASRYRIAYDFRGHFCRSDGIVSNPVLSISSPCQRYSCQVIRRMVGRVRNILPCWSSRRYPCWRRRPLDIAAQTTLGSLEVRSYQLILSMNVGGKSPLSGCLRS